MFYTDRQVAILEFLQRYRRMSGKSPTLGEIAEHFQVSKVTVHDHVRQLETKGAVRKAPHRARALEILDPNYLDPDPAEEASDAVLPVSVLGRIAAGQPIDAVETPETFDLADLLPMGRDHYALQVCGSSMIEDGIHDGDYIFVRKQQTAEQGEVVVVMVDGEATCKRFFREGERIRLQPANETMQPIYVHASQFRDVDILGKVVGVYRRLH